MNNRSVAVFFFSLIICASIYSMDNKKTLTQGILIAIEGIEGAGKSTLAQALHTKLTANGFNTLLTKERGDTQFGQEIRTIIQTNADLISLKTQALLFAADRAEHFEKIIIPALKQKKLIISDGFADSSVAYQRYGQGFDNTIIKNINAWTMAETKAHLTLFINVPVKIALERCRKKGELSPYEQKEFLRKMKKGFESLYYTNRTDVIEADGTCSPDELCDLTCIAIEEWLQDNNFYS